jgi:NADPH2:quinone reductase
MREPQENAANLAELGRWFEEGKLKPHVCATYPLERSAEALQQILDRKAKGKIVLTTR